MSHQKDFVLKGQPLGLLPDCSLGEYLLAKARAHPQDKTIQVDAETGAVQTVGELLSESMRLSEGLRQLGVEQNDVVGMICKNSFEAGEIVLGTWLNGAAVAPLPGTMAVGEFKHIFGIVKPKIVFCEEEAVSNATAALSELSLSSKVILMGSDKNSTHMTFPEVLADVDVDNFQPRPITSPSSQLVAILSSSGTSGLPKGVGLTHTNLIFQDFNMEALDFLKSAERILQISQFFWVTGVIMFLGSLTTGRPRILLRNPTVPNCLKAIDKYKPETSMASPLFVMFLATHPDFEKYDVSSMKTFLVGGSPLIPSIYEKIKEKWPQTKLVQLYGTTEVSGTICSNYDGDPYAIGTVTPGVQLKVVDRTTGEPLKANDLGEILIKTPGLMKCYVGNDKATREAIDADGWFHSGDVGYYDDSGQVYLVDRMKEMVKINDMQVAPTEVENTILSIPGVVEASVFGLTKGNNVYELLATVVKHKTSTLTAKDIQDHVANTLSTYKRLTGGVYFMECLPKTASGKINRSKLKTLAEELYLGK